MSDVNSLLYRVVKPDKKLMALIPDGSCERSFVGKGMTDFSVDQMVGVVKQYATQMQAVAPLLKGRNLEETCGNIHDFCYNNFQYDADLEDQYLRSPACAKTQRFDGIDCKTYSIIASCILVNLDIKHYIRRVKQPYHENPNAWTHVYVIVPDDQKKGSLEGGYYVIDGTVPDDLEGIVSEVSDKYMSGMNHYVLNGQAGLNGFNLNSVINMFSSGWSPSCIGGTLDSNDFKATATSLTAWFGAKFDQINNAVANNDPAANTLINDLLTTAQQVANQSARYAKYGWSSSCSKGAAKAYGQLGAYYNDMCQKAFLAWLESYFTVSYKTVDGLKAGSFAPATPGFEKEKSFNGGTISVKNVAGMVMKPGTTTVFAFEVTPYVQDKNNYANFDPATALKDMTQVLAQFGVKTGSSSGNNTGSGSAPGYSTGGIVPDGGGYDNSLSIDKNLPVTPAAPQRAGAGTVIAVVLGGVALTMVVRAMMGKPAVKGVNAKK